MSMGSIFFYPNLRGFFRYFEVSIAMLENSWLLKAFKVKYKKQFYIYVKFSLRFLSVGFFFFGY